MSVSVNERCPHARGGEPIPQRFLKTLLVEPVRRLNPIRRRIPNSSRAVCVVKYFSGTAAELREGIDVLIESIPPGERR